MSQNQQWVPPSGPPGEQRGGSVRRARERMEAGLPPEMPAPPPQKPYNGPPRPTQSPPSNRIRPPLPTALAGPRAGQGPIGVAISRPTQVPQWPLSGTIVSEPEPRNGSNEQYQPPAGRGAAPPRPQRPSRVPSMLDASRVQDHTPTFQYKPQQNIQAQRQSQTAEVEELRSPVGTSGTASSRPSTISSVGSIPDFPLPIPIPIPSIPVSTPRRSANLGPPPSSRRGASSYYSQGSFVSPIPEESPHATRSHESYASSAAIPSSWGGDSPGYEYDEDDLDGMAGDYIIEEGRESRESNGDDSDERGLVRKASIGKRVQPSMVTTKGLESQRPALRPEQVSKLERMGVLAGSAAVGAAAGAALEAGITRDGQRETVWPTGADMKSPVTGGRGLISKSSSEESVPMVATAVTTDNKEPASTFTGNPNDPKANEILGAYQAASSLHPGEAAPDRTTSPFNRLSAVRRPPRLNIDAVREAEARGSLTSLPDLIRRATRLAAMMDRGRRPASRLNDLNDFPSPPGLSDEKILEISSDEKHQSGLSKMLAAFPPPGLATPTRDPSPRPISTWPSTLQDSNNPLVDTNVKAKNRRRCCGLPIWGFLVALLIILIIIAAAIIVPLELLVFHKPKSATTTVNPQIACERELTCENGGQNVISSGVCICICTDGFTGTNCTIAGETGCSTTTVSTTETTVENVTIGDAIERLIDAALTNFSIPLFTSSILARFNAANLSCNSENALVTFDGTDTLVGDAEEIVFPSSSDTSVDLRIRQKRTTATATTSTSSASTSISHTITSVTTSPTTTSTTSTTTTTTVTSFAVTGQVLDFARVVVLFILQQETIDSAITAQTELQKFFSDPGDTNTASNFSIGDSNTVDLVGFHLSIGNGTVGSDNIATNESSISYRRW